MLLAGSNRHAKSLCYNQNALMVSFHIRAEVVELADTPSTTAHLDVPGNLLTTKQIPYSSFTCALA